VLVSRLEPGDLVFFGSGPTHITHVGLVIAQDVMINAPDFGVPVRLDPIGKRAVGATHRHQGSSVTP
jgi:cell wall-associated NlpC family hydrolase